MKRTLALAICLLNFFGLGATHNRAGEITYVQVSEMTYEITITTFTYTLSLADRPQLDIDWGDNTIGTAQRDPSKIVKLPNYYQKNVYVIRHTYPGPGIYKLVVQDPNRNLGVKNIPNSVNVVFSISTILIVNPAMGRNSTPVLLNPPYDKAAKGYVFVHNPAAYDPDGDSLSYKLSVCTRDDGKAIENYSLPAASHSFRMDSISGDLIWDTPVDTGKYNVAIEIQEWRNGRKIGIVVRDMQIEVYETNNKPPVNSLLKDMCVEVGDAIDLVVSATDANNDKVLLKATSGIFSLVSCPALFNGIDTTPGFSSARFTWTPCHEAVRNQPYDIIIKADDNNSELSLTDIDNMSIKVLGPSPKLVNALPMGKYITLVWQDYGTDVITGFNIYRREGQTSFSPDSCTSGIPSSTGFIKIAYVSGSSATSFTDTGNGPGLQFGKEFTYRIVALYPNLAESKTSNEITSTLISGVPIIKNVSVINTSAAEGRILLSWRNPDTLDIDTIPNADGPYEYIISRANGIAGTNFTFVTSMVSSKLTDSVYIDTLINTLTTGYIYKMVLWNRTPGFEFIIGDSSYASSVFLTASPGDRKMRFTITRNVPWINERYDYFRYNGASYDSIGTTTQLSYTDEGLVNGTEYCYYVRSVGNYPPADMPKNLLNNSQETCAVPIDNEPPCIPDLNVKSLCDSTLNEVKWEVTDAACLADIAGYHIFYKALDEDIFSLVETINDKDVFSIIHDPDNDIVSGCYAVSAFDLLGNESDKSIIVCVDSCNYYEIPNVFTPNGDQWNEELVAKTSGLVEKVDFKIFNRNGLLLFQTDNPRIEWNGTYKGKIVSPGVYFYQCDVYERRISGLEQQHKSGFVHVITEQGAELKDVQTK
jgi:gliding motility-associated-like protein